MKLAKKTLSVALAAIMAVSSAAVATSAFALDYVEPTTPVAKAIKEGTTTVTPDIKIDNKFAAKKADITDEAKAKKNIANQIDPTTLSNYYSFTPDRTGYYWIEVESTPVYEGYSKTAYYTAYEANKLLDEKDRVERATNAAHKFSNTYEGLYKDTTFTAELEYKTDAKDSVTIDNMSGKDDFLKKAETASTKVNADKGSYTMSWKYDAKDKKIVVDKEDKFDYNGSAYAETKDQYLIAGKTYYFMVTVDTDCLLTTEVAKVDKVDYVNVVKTDAKPSAKVTITRSTTGFDCYTWHNDVDKDGKDLVQKVTVPENYAVQAGEKLEFDAKTKTWYVEKKIYELKAEAYNNGLEATIVVPDTYKGVPVTYFENNSTALKNLTLGKNVEAVSGCAKKTLTNVVITNPNMIVDSTMFHEDAVLTVPSNSVAGLSAMAAGYQVKVACSHAKTTVVKAATVFHAGQAKCNDCDKVIAIAKLAFKPSFKAKKGAVEVKGNAGKVAKVAVWVDGKKTVKKNVTKCTVKGLKAGKHVVKVKLYDADGHKTASVKKTVKVK